jgi:hypothetical protein
MAVAALVFFFETGQCNASEFFEQAAKLLDGGAHGWQILPAINIKQCVIVRLGVEFLTPVSGDTKFRQVVVFDADLAAVGFELLPGEARFAAEWIPADIA